MNESECLHTEPTSPSPSCSKRKHLLLLLAYYYLTLSQSHTQLLQPNPPTRASAKGYHCVTGEKPRNRTLVLKFDIWHLTTVTILGTCECQWRGSTVSPWPPA
mmetsp:Transcript_41618/g.85089  ORF Transcript_41618/g.85089 Transcript_41618/m.85089 type:complete len:103 (+) Transcript_41618:201-509(+)